MAAIAIRESEIRSAGRAGQGTQRRWHRILWLDERVGTGTVRGLGSGGEGSGAALEVGYQSLSHFAIAFREETGRSPSEWLGGMGS